MPEMTTEEMIEIATQDPLDDTRPVSLVPAVNYLKEEALKLGLDETAHFLEAALEALKDAVLERMKKAH